MLSVRSPDEAKVKQKMVYAGSKEAIRRRLVGIAAEVQATDLSEVLLMANVCLLNVNRLHTRPCLKKYHATRSALDV